MNDEIAQRLVFLDTETTGREEEDRIFQVAYEYDGQEYCEMFKPSLPLCVEAMEATGYTNKDVEGKPSFTETDFYRKLSALLAQDDVVLVAHNAPFDVEMLRRDGVEVPPHKVIDTLKLARHLDSEAKLNAYRLQYLRYALELEVADAAAHDALGDVRVLKALFVRLYKKMEQERDVLAKMVEVSTQPVLIRRFTFGKHIGKLVTDVAREDTGYLEWLLRQREQEDNAHDENADWIFTLRHALGKLPATSA